MDHDLSQNDEIGDAGTKQIVGYRNPPKHTQWPRGYCPNPAGRPRKAKGRGPILERIANELLEVKVEGRVRTMTRLEAIAIAVRNSMANGDPVAQKLYDKLLKEVTEDGPPTPKGVLIVGEGLTQEEWELEYGHLGRGSPPPPPKPIQMEHIRHLLRKLGDRSTA